MTNLEVSQNGLKKLEVSFTNLPNFCVSSLLLHNTFNKNLIERYETVVDRLKFSKPVGQTFQDFKKEYDRKIGGNVWYID